jgi:hypothetical protein
MSPAARLILPLGVVDILGVQALRLIFLNHLIGLDRALSPFITGEVKSG